jgi:hypothetical protein
MDKDDPPMMFTPGKQDKGVHSQRFVDALEKRAKEVGASLIIEDERKELIQFMFAKLRTKPKPASGTRLVGKPVGKPFPQHWGVPPAIQTRDYRKLPADYGFGSSTLANWIQEKLDNDSKK